MKEETKSRTQQDVKAEYTQHAIQLGEKIDLKDKLKFEIAEHRESLKKLRREFMSSLPTPAATETSPA